MLIFVDGVLMVFILYDCDWMIVNKIGYYIGDLKCFDIIVFWVIEDKDYIKCIIGLLGDEIEYCNDKLYVNGKVYEELYLDK